MESSGIFGASREDFVLVNPGFGQAINLSLPLSFSNLSEPDKIEVFEVNNSSLLNSRWRIPESNLTSQTPP